MSDNDTSSIGSDMSQVSVSYNGEDDMPLDEAVDMIFSEIQTHINEIHVQLRMLCQSEDRADTYDEALEYHEALSEHVKDACTVFKDVIKCLNNYCPRSPKVGSRQTKTKRTYLLSKRSSF